MADKESKKQEKRDNRRDVRMRSPVQDGFLSGMGVISAVLLTALVFTIVYIFYLAFLA